MVRSTPPVSRNRTRASMGDADFWEVSVAAWLSNNNSDNNNHHGLYFRMWTDGCPSQCYYTATVNKIERFMFTGHGHSAWSFSTPDSSCRVVNIWNIHLKDVVHCTTTLSLGTNSNNSGSIATIRHAMSSTRRHNTNTSATTTITKPTVPVSTLVVVVVVVVVSIVLGVLSAVAVRLALLVKELKKKKSRTHDDVLGVSGCRRCTVLQKPAGRLVREGTHRGRPLTALSITEHTQRTDRIGE
ncbi:hypothetical protein O3P69_009516 [Scylla paramamosain]|uniref:Uncharacterized protein n=1 Tax=Scylla paramamosain TaxID=85552 RepID=A0AAW0SVS6_SCYPA